MSTHRPPSGERGIALVIVMLMLMVLTAMGFMALIAAGIERDLDRSYRNRFQAKDSIEACVQQQVQLLLFNGGLRRDPFPPGENGGWTAGLNPPNTQRHPVIGACAIVDAKCGNIWATSDNIENVCCCRTGPLLRNNGNILYLTDFVTDRNMVSIGKSTGGHFAGAAGEDFALFNFSVTAGGPSRSIAESKVMVKYGPVPGGNTGETDKVGM